VIGDGAKVGAGAMLRETVVLPGAEVGSGSMLVAGVYGPATDRPLG
jgi:hypothetical protein